jgi:predicted O-methyltransferase YrrM
MVKSVGAETFLSLMAKIRRNTLGSHPVSENCGGFLSILLQIYAQHLDFVNVVEVGTGVGYSTFWLAKGLIDSETPGIVYTIENVSERVEMTRYNLKKMANIKGLEKIMDYVELIFGDALEVIPKLDMRIDFTFIDGRKEEYLNYLNSWFLN